MNFGDDLGAFEGNLGGFRGGRLFCTFVFRYVLFSYNIVVVYRLHILGEGE